MTKKPYKLPYKFDPMVHINGPCKHLGKPLQRQRVAGCNRRAKETMVYECSIYGRASPKRKVLMLNSRRPDQTVSICLGCPKRESA